MTPPWSPIVFLLDVDNTLIDNDRVAADLKRHLTREVGAERQERYWAIFEATPTTSVPSSAIASSTRAIRISSRCPRSS